MIEVGCFPAAFERDRRRLWALAYRMLGSTADAEDALQEVWLRLHRAESSSVENPGGWLTTVTARVCLNLLRARRGRGEGRRTDGAENEEARSVGALEAEGAGPESAVLTAEAVGAAMMVLLERLRPAERVAFVLHDVYEVPFEEVATVVGRTPTAVRQLASRARRRLRDRDAGAPRPVDRRRHRELVDAFLDASRHGRLERLVAALDPDAVLSTGSAVAAMGGPARIARGAEVASFFTGRARAARRAAVDGRPAAVWLAGSKPRVVFDFSIDGEPIARIHLSGQPDALALLDLELVGQS